MKSIFYFSRIIGNCVYLKEGRSIGKVNDLIVELGTTGPKIIAISIKTSTLFQRHTEAAGPPCFS